MLDFLNPAEALFDGLGVGLPLGALIGAWIARNADSAKRYLLEEKDIDGKAGDLAERVVQKLVERGASAAEQAPSLLGK